MAKNEIQENGGLKYATFEHTFTDKWEDVEKDFSFRFAKPTKMHIQRMQQTAGKNSAQAARNLLADIIHPEDKETFLSAAEAYPGLITSYAGAVIKAVGIADLGN